MPFLYVRIDGPSSNVSKKYLAFQASSLPGLYIFQSGGLSKISFISDNAESASVELNDKTDSWSESVNLSSVYWLLKIYT